VREAHTAGQRHFGESYAQEATDKMAMLDDLDDITWHFIGPIQSNKTKVLAERFSWVHSVDRSKIVERLSAQRPAALDPLQICIQLNLSGEASKNGCSPAETHSLAELIIELPRLKLRGLMTVPEPTADRAAQRMRFESLHALLNELNRHGLALDTLSMGMSDDLEQAIAAGATMVRVGTAIFGARA